MADEPMDSELIEHQARIQWEIPDSIVTRYATNILVQRSDNEYILSFFELRLPFLMGSVEEQQKQMEEIHTVQAVCVGRVIIAKDKMPDVLKAIESLVPASTNANIEDGGSNG